MVVVEGRVVVVVGGMSVVVVVVVGDVVVVGAGQVGAVVGGDEETAITVGPAAAATVGGGGASTTDLVVVAVRDGGLAGCEVESPELALSGKATRKPAFGLVRAVDEPFAAFGGTDVETAGASDVVEVVDVVA